MAEATPMDERDVNILLVEDDEGHAGLIRRAFQSRAPQVNLNTAATLQEARDYLAQSTPDLLIADLVLPDGLGTELLTADAPQHGFPAIVMTSFGNEQAAVDAMKAGALDYVVKSKATLGDMPRIAERTLEHWENLIRRKRAEAELRKSQAFLQTVIDAIPEVTMVVDREYRVTLANRAARELTGYEDPVVKGMMCYEVFHHRDAPCHTPDEACPLKQVVATKAPVRATHRHLHTAGDATIVEITAAPIFDESGEVVQMVESCRDTTARKQAENALRRSERDYRTLFENAHNGLLVFDPKDETILEVNRRACQIYGFRREELVGRSLDLIQPEDRRGLAKTREILENGAGHGVELIHRRKDGTEVCVEVNADVVDYEGRKAILSINRDVTERKRAEEALRESEEKFRGIAERSFDAIFTADPQGHITYVSPAIETILGFPPEEVAGKHFKSFLPESEMPRVMQHFAEATRGAYTDVLQFEARKKDDQEAFLELSHSRILQHDEVVGVQGVIRDVTQRKRAEISLQESEQKYRMLVEGSLQGIIILQDFRICFANAAAEIAGLTVEELLNLSREEAWEILAPECREVAFQNFQNRFAGKPISPHWEYRIRRKDGREICLETFIGHIDYAGEPAIQVAFLDITERKRAEEALRESEYQLAMAIECAGLGLWDQNFRTGSVTRGNNWMRMLGYEPGEIELDLTAWKELIHPDDRSRVEQVAGDHEAGLTETFSVEHRMRTKSGQWKWIRNWGRVIERDEDGKPIRAIGLHLDITDRKQAEEALRASEEQYRLHFENASDVIYSIDSEFRFLNVSPSVERALGYRPEELIGKSFPELGIVAPHEMERMLADTQRVFAGESVSSCVYEMVAKDGSRRFGENSSVPVFRDGKVVATVSMARDITERKEAEEALQEQHRRLRTIFAAIPDPLVLKDRNFAVAAVNPAACEMLGRSEAELLGKTDFDLFSPEEAEVYRDGDLKVIATGRTLVQDETVTGVEGPRFMHVAKTPVIDASGNASGILVSLRDFTERKQVELELAEAKRAAEAASRAKSDFLANMSHEIRTPMTAILGFADLLMSPNISQREQREHLQTIRRNGQALLDLINDILDLSKIEAGRMLIEPIECSIWDVVEDVMSLMRVPAEEKGLYLHVDYAFPLPRTIHTDPVRLRQILTNLVSNAVKFTERGDVQMSVRCTTHRNAPPRMEFAVTDTGIGMRPQEVTRLFKPFVQLDTSAARRFSGTGLGLTISKRLAEKLGGNIEVETKLGAGSTFTLLIDPGPLQAVPWLQETPERKVQPAVVEEDLRFSGLVLVAEDGRDVQNLIRFVLGNTGLEVDLAENGRVACRKALASAAEGRPYDLILMDIQMPQVDGYQATRQLRRDGWQRPIVALTAHAMAGDREKCLQAGCDDYLVKPVDRAELLATIGRFLGQPTAGAAANVERPTRGSGSKGPLISSKADHPVLADLLEDFVDELPQRSEKIQNALHGDDLQCVIDLAHQLKGAAGIYGFDPIAAMARKINKLATRGADRDQIQTAVTELTELCTRATHGRTGDRS